MNHLAIKTENKNSTSEALNALLCNYQVYYQNLRNYHWNISGNHFFDLHNQFEGLYNEAETSIDEIAERILTLRMKPISTLAQYLEFSQIKEESPNDAKDMVRTIMSNHDILIKSMMEVIGHAERVRDEGTVDMITGFLGVLEKKSWMFHAWLDE